MSIWKIAALAIGFMGLFCLQNLAYVALAPLWRKVQARIVSNRTVYHASSVEDTEEVRRIPSPIIRVAYHYGGREHEAELGNANSLVGAKPGDLVGLRVVPGLPRVTCLDTPMHPITRIAAIVIWGALSWGLLCAAHASWQH